MGSRDKGRRKASRPATADLVVALSHPLRRGILRVLLEGRGSPLSPKAIAASLERPLSGVAYHVRVLADMGAVTLTETRKVRGTFQHFYLPTEAVSATDWARQAVEGSEDFD
jgi:DNA-binding transcriptional ArsR family regulator